VGRSSKESASIRGVGSDGAAVQPTLAALRENSYDATNVDDVGQDRGVGTFCPDLPLRAVADGFVATVEHGCAST
jgi:hypothetical protein